MRNLIVISAFFLISLSSFSQELIKAWETEAVFQKPESALYDDKNDVIYISNLNGKFLAEDGNGFISKINTDGTIISLKWITGLNNPQGLGLFKNKLYVADINTIVQIDIEKSSIEKTFKIDSAKFLNDITVDESGCVYVSDCFDHKIYRLKNGRLSIWQNQLPLENPNGLLCLNNSLFILNNGDGTIYKSSVKNDEVSKLVQGINQLDGIVSDGNDGYFVTTGFSGKIYHISKTGDKELLLDLGDKKIITADLDFINMQNLLIIPTLDRHVFAFRWKWE